ncbi:DUF2989 domain-containing protein [Alginatibacterium sediminis]|uniref:DUF2989 domain-containing protein n=1 Tax=Alginatibacterium sediminis TaxID=2164068 RepID=A0A420EIF4_9ALTE|nr:DUF2989 domain-containing protein [Alginatibacterium sediminis]RKF20433.1 DUF2989 domain-containing protein [Alginatibacterium sediminis]
MSKVVFCLSAVLGVFLLSACEDSKAYFRYSVAKICDEDPTTCAALSPDGWCKAERETVISSDFLVAKLGDDKERYNLLQNYQSYIACMEVASTIIHKANRAKTDARVEGLIFAKDELAKLELSTTESDNAYLLFYHWSVKRDENAKAQFLALEGQEVLRNTFFQLSLARYYAEIDPQKSLDILFYALTLYTVEETIDNDHFAMITNRLMRLKQYEKAYVWALVYQNYAQDAASTDLSYLQQIMDLSAEQRSGFEQQADDLIELIDKRHFRI